MRRWPQLSLIAIVVGGLLGALGHAFAQLPWGHPAGKASGSAAPTVALDATATCTNSNGASCAYHATSSNDMILAIVGCGRNLTGPPTVTGVTGGSLSWAQRSTKLSNGASGLSARLDVWYAIASGGFNDTVAASFSGACPNPTIIVRGVVNANPSTPWDPNGSLPATAIGTGSSTTMSVSGISTSNHNTMLLSAIGTPVHNFLTGPDIGGWVVLGGTGNFGGCCWDSTRANEDVVSTAQSSVTVTYGGGAVFTAWTMTVDAILDATQ